MDDYVDVSPVRPLAPGTEKPYSRRLMVVQWLHGSVMSHQHDAFEVEEYEEALEPQLPDVVSLDNFEEDRVYREPVLAQGRPAQGEAAQVQEAPAQAQPVQLPVRLAEDDDSDIIVLDGPFLPQLLHRGVEMIELGVREPERMIIDELPQPMIIDDQPERMDIEEHAEDIAVVAEPAEEMVFEQPRQVIAEDPPRQMVREPPRQVIEDPTRRMVEEPLRAIIEEPAQPINEEPPQAMIDEPAEPINEETDQPMDEELTREKYEELRELMLSQKPFITELVKSVEKKTKKEQEYQSNRMLKKEKLESQRKRKNERERDRKYERKVEAREREGVVTRSQSRQMSVPGEQQSSSEHKPIIAEPTENSEMAEELQQPMLKVLTVEDCNNLRETMLNQGAMVKNLVKAAEKIKATKKRQEQKEKKETWRLNKNRKERERKAKLGEEKKKNTVKVVRKRTPRKKVVEPFVYVARYNAM